MSDHPFDECIETASQLIDEGATIYQKFTCRNCNSRQTIDEPNKFFTHGKCEECQHITDLRFAGCNYLLIWGESGVRPTPPK
jgi:hypothetical protein